MTTFVLIHGSTTNAACWDHVRPLLADPGHETIAVDLPPDHPEFNGADFTRVALEQMAGAPDDCIVVAHSAAGVLIPRIAAARPVGAAVFLAAAIPEPGLSVTEQLQKAPDMLDAEWLAAAKEWTDPKNWQALADRFLFPDERPEDIEWAHSTLRPMRLDGLARDPLPAEAKFPPSLCIVATLDRTINPAWQERVWREKKLGRMLRMEVGHCPHMSRPGQTAEAILSVIGEGERRGRREG